MVHHSPHSFPLERLLAMLPNARRSGVGWSAKCPAHEDRRASLSIRSTGDGTVLVRCFAGCSAHDVVKSVGLELRDLFPPRPDDTSPVRPQRPPSAAMIRESLDREVGRLEAELEASIGFVPPRSSTTINRARARVSRIYGVALDPVAGALWELAPHAEDPWWPSVFTFALQAELRAIFGPDAWRVAEYEAHGVPVPAACIIRAEDAAARQLHRIARRQRRQKTAA